MPHPDLRRVSVVGNSGSGKSTFARRLAEVIGAPHVEIDAINHLPGWEQLDRAELCERLGPVAATDTWVIDGNYAECVVDGPVWARADTVVWLDLPRATVMRQLVARSVRRVLRREVLWNGNRERIGSLVAWDPERSIIRWAWTRHRTYAERYASAATSPRFAHLRFVRLWSHTEADAWIASLSPPGSARLGPWHRGGRTSGARARAGARWRRR